MVYRLIDFVIMVLKLLMFNVCGIIDIPKMEFFSFFDTERVNMVHFIKLLGMKML